MRFIPFLQVKQFELVLIVDSFFVGKTMFSHWRGAPRLEGLHDDTSTGIVLNALKAKHPACQYPFVSNNHFDIDGFLGVWALMNPELSLQYEAPLREAALIGDFREWNPENTCADQALKICCWINSREKELFYLPFGEKMEAQSCVEKYKYFLDAFESFLVSPDVHEKEFIEEYKQVWSGHELIDKHGLIEKVPDIRLQIVHAPEPVHYYALFQGSEDVDMVQSRYDKQRYELEYKYTNWVDTQTRCSFARMEFGPLAEKLIALEQSAWRWEYDRIMDTGPMLRLNKSGLTKSQRFDHPFKREIYSSSIAPDTFTELVKGYYRDCFRDKSPQTSWTWKEMRAFAI